MVGYLYGNTPKELVDKINEADIKSIISIVDRNGLLLCFYWVKNGRD